MLSIVDLIKKFQQPGGGELTVLDVPKFEMTRGEQVALIGESGGGKTTLLHLIAGMLTATSGSIRVDNLELTKLSEQGRDRFRAATIGYVFQTFNLLPAFSAIENVKLGMTFGHGGVDGARALDLLERVGLADRAHYRPKQLSVGQQQRVAIARALAGQPKLLLADEPTANVDPASADAVLDLIIESCRQDSIALLMVTHSMDVADRFSRVDRLEDINRIAALHQHPAS
ncbi:ABC transporter ATP-binding protein [Allorhodopirellula heiligendammensis]|uniref:Lipoprotein-releasing system ATP-binding protein LolD n=1 Tax=Allorhodopirellula heiligendammensis TaxID=2714739 RepID=A0A5C6BGX1_9BACT|nr:ABC transporter ATP-binding protein [Allorhodopirellula heiligendammensis]TWU10972.1 Lipoprotein-releasing system ATP-binding protein LolD [Allorhodopirellula heiligendammensis]